MKKHNLLFIILLGITITSCSKAKKSDNSLFSFDESKFQAHYMPQEGIELGILKSEFKRSGQRGLFRERHENWQQKRT